MFAASVDPVELGREWLEILPIWLQKADEQRRQLPNLHTFTATELRTRPGELANTVLDAFGCPLRTGIRGEADVSTKVRPRSPQLRPLAHFGLRSKDVLGMCAEFPELFDFQ